MYIVPKQFPRSIWDSFNGPLIFPDTYFTKSAYIHSMGVRKAFGHGTSSKERFQCDSSWLVMHLS